MNSIISGSRLLAVVLCAAAFTGCDSVKDVLAEPDIATPTPTAVLQGTISGLGTRRPLVLQNNGVSDQCPDRNATAENAPKIECRFFGVPGQSGSTFSFGSVPVGTPYNITVKTQPFAKICSIANGTGTVGAAGAAPITVECVNDPAVQRYPVSGTIAAAASAIPGLKIQLTTEDGVREIDGTGLTTFTFPDAVFNSGFNLPIFTWTVTATSPEDGTVYFCNVTGGTNIGENTTAPTGPVTGINVVACRFNVGVAVALDAGQTSQPLGAGMRLALRHQRTGVDVQEINVNSFSTVTFTNLRSNQDAIYELVITQQPAGQACVVGSGSQLVWGGAVLLINPTDTTHRWTPNPRNVRCRAIPAAAGQLRGSYQLTTLTTSTTTGNVTTALTRNFLTFFDNGTFLYGAHGTGVGCSTACGVEYGFYTYNSGAQTIVFTPYTDTSTGTSAGLSSGGAATTLNDVVKISGSTSTIEATLSATVKWRLIEPPSVEGQMAGTWATPDNRRVWIFNGSTYAGFHAGVNGLANAQDGCFSIDDVTSPTGYYTRRGNATTCRLVPGEPSVTNVYSLDIPSANTTPRFPEGFTGKWPAASSQADGRPSSPANYTITAGTPDTLTIRPTLNGLEEINGVPVLPPIIFHRTRSN